VTTTPYVLPDGRIVAVDTSAARDAQSITYTLQGGEIVTAVRALPVLEPGTPGESLQGYGLRVLGFVVRTGITATLSLEDLQLADHMYPIAVSGHDLSPSVVDTLSHTRRQILDAIKWLEVDRPKPDRATPVVIAAGTDRPNHGPMARLIPAPISRPPSGTAVDIRF